MLSNLSCVVDIADSGKQALSYFESDLYHLILMDIGLIDANGLDIANQMRLSKNYQKSQTPIAIITAHSDENYKNQAWSIGIQDFIVKPCTYEILDKLLSKYVLCN